MNDTSNTYSIADIFNVKATKGTNIIQYNAVDNTKNISEITESDVKYSHDNIMNMIEIGRTAISELSNIASQGQQPLAYEVLASLMKVQLAANKDLLNIHKMNKELTNVKEDSPKTVNQNLFVGSTAEMADMLKKIKKD